MFVVESDPLVFFFFGGGVGLSLAQTKVMWIIFSSKKRKQIELEVK